MTGMSRRRAVPFGLFWSLALLSNTCAAAQSAAVLWLLGADGLPGGLLLVYQLAGVVGTLAGVAVGSRVTVRLGHRRCIALSSGLEAAGCLAVAAASLAPSGALDPGQAVAVAVLLSTFPFAAGIGGPAWLALVSRWPGTAAPTRQLLLDSTQFQAGSFVGPLVGAAVLAATVFAVQVVAVVNAITFGLIAAVVLALRAGAEDVADRAPRRPWRDTSTGLLAGPSVWGLTALAVSADAARVYLPRFIQEQGGQQAVYSVSLSALALAAVASAALASRLRITDRVMSAGGLGLTALALLSWGLTPQLGAGGWVLGGLLLGCGISLATASLTSTLMSDAGEGRPAAAAGTAMAVRTGGGAAGGVVMAGVAGLGAVACLPFAVAPLAAAALVALGRR